MIHICRVGTGCFSSVHSGRRPAHSRCLQP